MAEGPCVLPPEAGRNGAVKPFKSTCHVLLQLFIVDRVWHRWPAAAALNKLSKGFFARENAACFSVDFMQSKP